jgi:hypothetical protein
VASWGNWIPTFRGNVMFSFSEFISKTLGFDYPMTQPHIPQVSAGCRDILFSCVSCTDRLQSYVWSIAQELPAARRNGDGGSVILGTL